MNGSGKNVPAKLALGAIVSGMIVQGGLPTALIGRCLIDQM